MSPERPSGYVAETITENPVEAVKGMMLDFKHATAEDSVHLTAEDEARAAQIAQLEGVEMLRAYNHWCTEIAAPQMHSLRGEVVESTRLKLQYETMAMNDAITGAYNRRYFEDHINQTLQKLERKEITQLSLLMLDLDHFKAVNDLLGHQLGDIALRELVTICKETVRGYDIISRYGGEEFAIVMETGQKTAMNTAERIRQKVEAEFKARIKAQCHESKRALVDQLDGTISIGVTSWATKGGNQTIETLVEEADTALYHSKNTGRNQVTYYDPQVITGQDTQEAQTRDKAAEAAEETEKVAAAELESGHA